MFSALRIPNGRISSRLGRGILLLLNFAIPVITQAADEGELIASPPVPYKTYTFTPGKLTGQELFLEKENLHCKVFCFDQYHAFPKPTPTVDLRISLRGGYRAHDIFGHDDFVPKEAQNVATGWVPQANGNFIIFPDESKQHLPMWVPERTRLIRVPFVKQYGDAIVNAYDIALGLDRFNRGDDKSVSIEFKIVEATDDSGKKGKRLVPANPLTDGVYYAYSLPDDKDTANYGFLFAVGMPATGTASSTTTQGQTTAAPAGIQSVSAQFARDVMDYALLSDAVYGDKSVPNWEKVDQGNCPIDLGLLSCSLESAKTGTERKLYGFNAQAYQNKNAGDKRLVITFRGTDGIMDFLADYGNAYLNGIPKQYQEALDFTQPLIEKYANAGFKIILTGHSLGGGLASYAAIRFNQPAVSAVVFNAAGLGGGITSVIKTLSDTQITSIKNQMSGVLSSDTEYLNAMLNKLISDAKFGINIPSITNIHLVGDPVALFPGQQAGVFTLLTVPSHFVWFDNSGKQIEQFSTIGSQNEQLAYNPLVPPLVPGGKFASLVGDAKNSQLLLTDYSKLLGDHQGVDVRSLPIEPHFMTNVINALKAKAANN